MSKIFALIKNEWIKQYKKISIKVILILVLAASLVAPFFLKYFNGNNDMKWAMESYQNNIEWCKIDMDSLDASAKNAEIAKKVYQTDIDLYQLRIDNKITWSDWRDGEINTLGYNQKKLYLLQGIQQGIAVGDLLNNIYDFDPMEIESFYTLSREDLQKEIDKLTSDVEKSKKMIKDNDYMSAVAAKIKNTEEEIASYNKEISELQGEVDKNKQNEELKKNLELAKKSKAKSEELLVVYKYRYDNKIPYDKEDWRHNTLEDVVASIECKNEELLTEDVFKQQFSYEINRNGYTYEKYQEDRLGRIAVSEGDLTLDWYSLENDIPQVKYIKDARSSLKDTYLVYVNIAIVLCIIIGGGIVSSEYSTGTVRLLMIRPVSRWKILLSKLVAVFIIGYGATFIGFLVNMISAGLAYGFGDFAMPILALKDGAVIHQNFILSLIPNLLYVSISLIFIIAVVFALSTVMKNTALAVGLTMVGFLGSMPAAMIAGQLGMTWVDKTFIPYVNLTNFVDGGSYMVEMLEKTGMKLSASVGPVHLLVLAAVFIGISFSVFVKRDVKN